MGTTRKVEFDKVEKEKQASILPLYAIVGMIMAIGLIPIAFLKVINLPVDLFAGAVSIDTTHQFTEITNTAAMIGIYSVVFILIMAVVLMIRRVITTNRSESYQTTWGCGYIGSISKMQYTASSFIRTYRKLASPFLSIKKFKTEADGIFPEAIHQETHPYDKLEIWLIDKPIYLFRQLLSRFTFLQNGNVQAYILYGFLFITLVILIPEILEKLRILINFINQL